MKSVTALVLVAVVSLGLWFVLRSKAPITITPIDDVTSPPEKVAAPTSLTSSMGAELATGPARQKPVKVERAPGLTIVSRGVVIVTLVPPKGVAAPKSVSFDSLALDFSEPQKSLPVEQEDGSWRYESLAVGRWRIRAFAQGFVDASKDVVVRSDADAAVSIPLEVGGAASWKVALTTGVVPETVRLALLDGRGVSIEGSYQTRGTTIHAVPSEVPALPAEGFVVGLKVGRYRLRASTTDGDPKEQSFEVKAGETVALEFTLPR